MTFAAVCFGAICFPTGVEIGNAVFIAVAVATLAVIGNSDVVVGTKAVLG